MAVTYFMDLKRLDKKETPVVVEYSFKSGSPTTYSSRYGADGGDEPEVEIVDAWLKSDENNIVDRCPSIKWTDEENEKWSEQICTNHIDEFDEDNYL